MVATAAKAKGRIRELETKSLRLLQVSHRDCKTENLVRIIVANSERDQEETIFNHLGVENAMIGLLYTIM